MTERDLLAMILGKKLQAESLEQVQKDLSSYEIEADRVAEIYNSLKFS